MAASSETPEEMRLLYQITVADLSYFKSQQWSVTNYALLIYAGLVGIAQFLKPDLGFTDRAILIALAVAVGLTAAFVLFKLQDSIRVRQSRLSAARDRFSSEFKAAWAVEAKGREFLHSIALLFPTVAIGFVCVLWLVGFRL
jgi:hypothetical protein